MQGKLASSQFDFGYTEQFCIHGVTSVFFKSCDNVVRDSLWFNLANRGSFRVDWENAFVLDTMQGNRASSRGERKSHGFSRVVAGAWGIFSCYGRDVHSKLEFVQ